MWFKKEEKIEEAENAVPLYLRLEKLYNTFEILRDIEDENLRSMFRVPVVTVHFKSDLGRVRAILNRRNTGHYDTHKYEYRMDYSYSKEGGLLSNDTYVGLFAICTDARVTSLLPTLLKNGKLTYKTIELAIHELENYVYKNYGTCEDIKRYHRRQIFKLGGGLE